MCGKTGGREQERPVVEVGVCVCVGGIKAGKVQLSKTKTNDFKGIKCGNKINLVL